jgi:HD superfamily phosphohydrolase
MPSSAEAVGGKIIVDSLHGDIHLNERELRILDTAAFQRLRRIKQLQMGQVTYPNATHTRFAHSLGTLAIMARIVDLFPSRGPLKLDKRQRDNLRMAALLHDVGHYPYSHLMEGLDRVALTEEMAGATTDRSIDVARCGYPSHEAVGQEIVTKQKALVAAIGGARRARQVADLFSRSEAADPQISKLLHSSFDMDRVDYLQRDSRAAGVPYGSIDANYLLNSLRISPTGMIGVAEKALPAAEQFLLARFFMHKAVYFHKTTYGIEEACRHLLRRIRDAGKFGMPRDGEEILKLVRSPGLAGFTDDYVDNLIHEAAQEDDPVLKALALCIETRRPPKLLMEVQVLEDAKHQATHRGMFFFSLAKRSVKALAEKYGIPLGQFLLCKTRPLRLEPRGSSLTADQARSVEPEQEDELIKVFVGDSAEPKSLVEVTHSLIHVCSDYVWQAFRLYVVYEGADRDDVLSRLQAEVSTWDAPG